jgi:polysaccharide pyruvyl transferase WcaK-like protein
MKAVLLSGYYDFGNLGDELMLKSIARIFEARSFSIYAVSKNIEYSEGKHPNIKK